MSADDHRITLAEAIAYTHAWQKDHPGERRAWMMTRGIIDEILKQPGCVGIRMYAGGERSNETIVMVGTDAAGIDIVNDTEAVIAQEGLPCPTWCSDGSPLLNSPAK